MERVQRVRRLPPEREVLEEEGEWVEEEAGEAEVDLEVDRGEDITKEEVSIREEAMVTSSKEDTEATSREAVAGEVTRAEAMVVDSRADTVVATKEGDMVETRAGMEAETRVVGTAANKVDMVATKEVVTREVTKVVTREETKVDTREDSNRVVTRATREAEITTREVPEATRVVTKADTEAVTKVTRAGTAADISSSSQEVQIRRGEEVEGLRTATSLTRSHTD